MNLLPFGKLPAYKPRKFVPQAIDLGDWPQIAPLFDQLERACRRGQQRCRARALVVRLERAFRRARRGILPPLHRDDVSHGQSGRGKGVSAFRRKSRAAAQAAPVRARKNLYPPEGRVTRAPTSSQKNNGTRGARPSEARYGVFDRDIKNHVELFRPENIPLETEEARLCQQYQKLSGSLTVNFRGEEKTLVQMGRYLEEPDRALRQEAWELVTKRRLQEADKFEDIFDKMLKLRAQIAKNAGFENYRDYAFRRLGRFDYTPDDCARFHDAVEKHVMPVVRELQAERRRQLKLEKLRPWDLAVDPLNRPPLKPFAEVGEMVSRTQKIFDRLDGGLAGGFQQMQDLRLLDLDNRKGKAPGGYQQNLSESRLPFIFMNAVGLQRDVETILHEAGHAFHALATRDEDFYAYRSAPIEFCEVASMSMELLGNEFIGEFYSAADANRARRVHLEGIIGIFPWVATVDAFQDWIYTHPNHTRDERRAAWLGLMDRFGGDVDWSGFENARAQFMAPAIAYFHSSVLLHRIRHRATRRVAGLGEFKTRQGKGVERLQKSARARRLASIAGTVCRSGMPV